MSTTSATPPVQTTLPTFEQLYDEYHARIFHHVRSLMSNHEEAEEITQEVFFKAACALSTLDPRNISSWIYRIATNTAYDVLRRRAVKLRHCATQDFESATRELADGIDLSEAYALREPVHHALQRLPKHYQDALIAFYLQDSSQAELAQVLGVTVRSLQHTLARARQAFRTAYEREVSA